MCPNRVEELESRVQELEATVRGLTDELIECKVRLRELEDSQETDDLLLEHHEDATADADAEAAVEEAGESEAEPEESVDEPEPEPEPGHEHESGAEPAPDADSAGSERPESLTDGSEIVGAEASDEASNSADGESEDTEDTGSDIIIA